MASASYIVRAFFALNRKASEKIASYFPHTTLPSGIDIYDMYEKLVAQHMNAEVGQVVADVGGGKHCPFAKYRNPAAKSKIIAVDVSEEALQDNEDVDEKRVANILYGLPFETEEIDLCVSRSVLEHLEDLERFVASSEQALKEGGYFIHLFPSKFAPFALLNQALPKALSQKLLDFFWPESRGILGFPAYYDKCYYSGVRRILKRYGFEEVGVHLSYYQSPYFSFLVPLFLVSALYEMIVYACGLKNLAAYVLIVAVRKDTHT